MVCVILIDRELRDRFLSKLLCTNETALKALSAQYFHNLG